MKDFERLIEIEPAFDCILYECVHGSKRCFPGSGQSHGRHGVEITWIVRRENRAVQFLLFTSWGLVGEKYDLEDAGKVFPPMPADLGYHSPEPRYEGQGEMAENCPHTGGACYYDGSGLAAEHPWAELCNHGGEALWRYLEKYWQHVFKDGEFPDSSPPKTPLRVKAGKR